MPAPEKPRGLRRVLRFVRRTLLVLFGLAVVVVGIALIAVHTDWGRNKIRGVIESSLESTFAGGAKVGAFEGSILGDFTIEGIELYDAEGKPAIKIGKLHGNAALWKLGRKVAELEELRIEDLEISIGKAALTKPSEEPTSDEPAEWSVKLPAIKIERGTFALRGEQPLSIDGIAMSGAVAIPAGGAISASRLEVAGTWREKKLPIVVTGGVDLDGGISIPDARLKVGDLLVVATGVVVDTQQPTGTVRITGSPESISAVVPALELPAGVNVAIEMRPSGRAADLSIAGSFGDARINGAFHADLEKRTAAGFLGADKVNLRRLLRSTGTRPPINVKGELALAVTADMNGVKGIVGVHGAAKDLPESDATIAIDATWKDAAVTVLATGEGDAQVAIDARVKRDGKTIAIDHARVVASAKQLAKPTGQRVDVNAQRLVVDARLTKPGTVAPVIDLAFQGTANGTRVSYVLDEADSRNAVMVSAFDSTFSGSLRDKLYVQSTTRVRGVYQGGSELGSGTVAANLLPDGRIFSRVDVRPAAAAVGLVASGYITTGDIVKVALADHSITPAVGAPWAGKGGTVTIVPATGEVRVRDVVTTSGSGRAKVEATIVSGTIDASVDAQGLPLAAVDPAYRGTVSGQLAVKRRGVRWDGGGTLVAQGLVIDPAVPVFDGDVKIGVAGRKVTLGAQAKSADIGGVRLELEVEGPRDLTDFAAWKRLERAAVRTAVISADKVTLDTLSATGGSVEGKLRIGGVEVEGSVDVKKVMTPLGVAEGTVTFTPLGNDLYASWNAMLSDVGEANIGVRIRFPQYPFDPAAWQQLNRNVVQSLTASFDDIAVDPVKLAKLGVELPYSGRADIRLAVGAAGSAATVDVDLRNIEGGELKKPIDLHAEATTDGSGTVASACVQRAKDGACAKDQTSTTTVAKLLEIKDVKIPVAFETWLTAPNSAFTVPVQGTVSIPTQSAPAYFAIIGREDFDPRKGTLEGTVKLDGTIAKPTGSGTVTLKKLQLISLVEGRMIPELSEMKITGDWDGTTGSLSIRADESNKGKFEITANGRPDRLGEAKGKFTAEKFDLAPLAAFLPGELAASQGELNALVSVTSFDPASARVGGIIKIDNGHVPLDPMVGTLRNATLQVNASTKSVTLTARGLLNACKNPLEPRCKQNITLDVKSPPDLSRLEATLTATKVSTIGEIEPVIDGVARADLRRSGREWTGDIYITKGKVVVPESTGDDLLDFEAPDDVFFTDNPPPKQVRFGEARVPTKAWLDARLHIASTQIDVEEYGVTGAIIAYKPLRLVIGDAVGLDGAISIEYGTAADLFGRAYEIEQNEIVKFDGTIDPEIDLQMFHRFPDLTLRVAIQGRLSDPDFPPKPKFTADQGNYSEDQLFGFFLGADPSGAASAQATNVATGAGASLLSQRLAKALKNVLPKKLQVIDYLGCEGATLGGGGSCSAGTRLLDGRVYIALKKRLTPLPNENPEELLGQYYLSKEWYIEGSGGTGSIIGTDLLWRRRW